MNLSNEQESILDRHAGFGVEWDEIRGVACIVRGSGLGHVDPQRKFTVPPDDLLALAGPRGHATGLRPLRDRVDRLRWRHIEYQQVVSHDGDELAVYGSKLVIHVSPAGAISSVQSSCYRDVEVKPVSPLPEQELTAILRKELERAANADELLGAYGTGRLMIGRPRLVVYPWHATFTVAYVLYAYGVIGTHDKGHGRAELCKMFVRAEDGHAFLKAPMARERSHRTTGFGVTPLGGPNYNERPLIAFRAAEPGPYHLRDTEHEREIRTYDLGNSELLKCPESRLRALADDRLPLSESPTGVWNRLRRPAVPGLEFSVADLAESQQPEVDLHYHLRRIYEWYRAVGGRVGWDDNRAEDLTGSLAIHGLAHVLDLSWALRLGAMANLSPALRQDGAEEPDRREFLAHVEFGDGDSSIYDYLSGCPFTVCHEYQHLVTDFSIMDDALEPGLDYAGWLRVVHEGVSDAMGALFTHDWNPRDELSPHRQPLRNLAFPRDGKAHFTTFDHFADALPSDDSLYHHRGVVLAHAAFLSAAGGVHHRQGRLPEHIPVRALGRYHAPIPNKPQVEGESDYVPDVSVVAPIFYRAITEYCATLGPATGQSGFDATVLQRFRDACETAAIDLHGTGSREHRTIVLAFYAVGLPPAQGYGPDVTLLPRGADWASSPPDIGLRSRPEVSLDLFVGTGSGPAWQAVRSTLDNPVENSVYCRVRNIGDQQARDVSVTFHYREYGNPGAEWLPVTDSSGKAQRLDVENLAPGAMNFPDSAQAAPPASAAVPWHLPEGAARYRLRATVACANDVNPFDKEVESDITSAPAA